MALATSGRAVLFAGTTVILSLLGLFLLQLPFMRGLAIGAIAAVVLVMLAATDPAAGHARVRRPGHRQAGHPAPPPERGRARPSGASGTAGAGPSSATRSSSWLVAVVVLVCLALPMFSMRLAFTDAGNDPAVDHHPPGLRRPGHRIRPRVQRPADRRRPGAGGRTGARSSSSTPGVRPTPGVAFASPAQFNPSGDAR